MMILGFGEYPCSTQLHQESFFILKNKKYLAPIQSIIIEWKILSYHI